MDVQPKQGIMGSPAPISHAQPHPISNQNQINAVNNNNTDKISQPSSKRIINKIPLDFNKLKQAGLDRKLAEALSKRNFGATKKCEQIHQQQQSSPSSSLLSPPSSSSSSSYSSSTPTLGTISGEAATSLPTQQQQLQAISSKISQRERVSQPIKKRSIMSNYIEKIVPETSTAERSLHVKAMLKNRILNKSKSLIDQPGGTTYIYQTPTTKIVAPPKAVLPPLPSTLSSTSTDSSPPLADFTVPIAKADLTVRPRKPPIVLNLVNQLPKHRAKCIQMSPVSGQKACTTQPSVAPSSTGKSSPPLIVLENKVLAPNEKINLSDLRLPSRPLTIAPTTSTRKVILGATDKLKNTQENVTSNNLGPPNVTAVRTVPSPGCTKTKVILNANKLKVSREKLAEIAKEVRQQVKQVELLPKSPPKATYQTFSMTSPTDLETMQPVQMQPQAGDSLFSTEFAVSRPSKSSISSDTLCTTDSVFPSYQQLTSSTPTPAPLPSGESLISLTTVASIMGTSPSMSATQTASSDSLITPVTVSDPMSTTSDVTPTSESALVPCSSSPKILSAVDYIAQLTAGDPNYENSFMELSPEELEMSRHFGYTTHLHNTSPVVEPETTEDLPIGKILKIQDIDILHATMDVDGDQANVLRISPNAMKLQDNMETMQTNESGPKVDHNVEPMNVITGESNLLRVTTIKQIINKEPKNQTLKLSESSKTIKMKKAKINLVSRNKRVTNIEPPINVENTQNGHNDQSLNESLTIESQPTEEQSKNDVISKDEIPTVATVQDVVIENQSEAVLPKSTSERDLTQLYHPPKMPKLKHNSNNNNNNRNNNISNEPQNASNVSLIDVLTQEPPVAQGEAQVPFRKEPDPKPESKLEPQPVESKPAEAVGIQNLLNHLKAENITPQGNLVSNTTSPVTSKSPTLALDKAAKALPRKKLVKTRPFLAKRNSKIVSKQEPSSTTPMASFPRNGSLLGEIQANGNSQRVTSSSTSDDDGQFLGVVNAEVKSSRSKQVKHLKAKETDISDDATPDYDETEGEDQQLRELPEEKPKTDLKKEENKINKDMKDSSLVEQEDSNSSDSIQSWASPMEIEEIPTEEALNSPESDNTSDTIREREVTASVIDPAKETEEVSLTQEAAIETEAIADPVEKVLPITVETLDDSENVTTSEPIDPKASVVNTELTSPISPTKTKRKSLENIKKPEETTKDEAEMETNKESLMVSSTKRSKQLPSVKADNKSSDELYGKPQDETPSTVKAIEEIQKSSPARNAETTKTDDTVKELNDSSAPAISPKKRGRKPKVRNPEDPLTKTSQMDNSGAGCLNEDSTTSTGATLITPKRGRKRRSLEEPKAEESQDVSESVRSDAIVGEELTVPLITPKKRGRKPKIRLDESVVENSQVTDQINEQTTIVKEDVATPRTEPVVVIPKKRGRKPKPKPDESIGEEPQTTDQLNELVTNIANEENSNPSTEQPVTTPKKRGRKPKQRNPDELEDNKSEVIDQDIMEPTIEAADESSSFVAPLTIPKKRGRKPRKSEEEPLAKKPKINDLPKDDAEQETIVQNPFNLRLLLINKREQLDTEEELREEGKGSGPLQCGLCLTRTTENNWEGHIAHHYGVGWLIGERAPTVSRSTIISDMTSYLRENKGKGLICRLCGRKLSSGLGMVGHLEGCGLAPQRSECEFCKRLYSKLSMIQHQRSCPKRFQAQEEETNTEEVQETEEQETVYSNSGRAKRRSTIKAETKLKKIRVHLQTGDENQCNDFDGDSSDYDINKDNESSVEYESDGVISFSENEESIDKRPKRSRIHGRSSKTLTRSKTNIFSRCRDVGVVVNKKWQQFTETNYAKDPLYTDYLPSYVKLSLDEANDLFNSRQLNSMRFAYNEVKDECDWKQLKPLEAIRAKNEFITYLGGPVRQLEWVPLPPTVSEQYLLCSLRRKMHGYSRNIDAKGRSALMMLLKCTEESSELDSSEVWPLQTKLHYGIRVPMGPVFSFAFMPSGGYIASSNRLGLLALATASSDVHLYALPLQLTDDENKNGSDDAVIELNSFITLRLDMNTTMQDQCTKVCWSEGSGHNLLVSGYASGNVALWDIGDIDGLNCFKTNNQCTFVPLHYFYLGERNISMLNLHYDFSGPRWLAVGTSTRKLRVYDLKNFSEPTPLVGDGAVNNFFKGCLTWPPIWETITIGCSSVFQIRFTRLLVLNPCGIMFTTKSLDYVLYNARDIHYNCQDNLVIVVTENGDLVFINPRELNLEPVIHKLNYNCRAVSYTELAKLNGEQPKKETALSANEFQRDYGVIVKPLTGMPKEKKDEYLTDSRRPRSELMPMTRLNTVRWNLNPLAQNWAAVGAEHGMLRILNFQRDEFF